MEMTFNVKTKVGEVHALGRKEYRVVKVKKNKGPGWSVTLDRVKK